MSSERLDRIRRDASLRDHILTEFQRLIRRRMGEHAHSELTLILQDGLPVRVRETHEKYAEELEGESF